MRRVYVAAEEDVVVMGEGVGVLLDVNGLGIDEEGADDDGGQVERLRVDDEVNEDEGA
jgi:hypothetical protein